MGVVPCSCKCCLETMVKAQQDLYGSAVTVTLFPLYKVVIASPYTAYLVSKERCHGNSYTGTLKVNLQFIFVYLSVRWRGSNQLNAP